MKTTLAVVKRGPLKNPDLSVTCAVLYQLSSAQANCKMIIMLVCNKPVK